MLKNSKKKLRKLGAFSLVLAQVAAVGVVAPMTSASAFAGSAITSNNIPASASSSQSLFFQLRQFLFCKIRFSFSGIYVPPT
jgi:hypothetical protein